MNKKHMLYALAISSLACTGAISAMEKPKQEKTKGDNINLDQLVAVYFKKGCIIPNDDQMDKRGYDTKHQYYKAAMEDVRFKNLASNVNTSTLILTLPTKSTKPEETNGDNAELASSQ